MEVPDLATFPESNPGLSEVLPWEDSSSPALISVRQETKAVTGNWSTHCWVLGRPQQSTTGWGLKQQKCIVSQSGGTKSNTQELGGGGASPEAKGHSAPAPPVLGTAGDPWHSWACRGLSPPLPPYSHGFLPIQGSVQMSPFYKDGVTLHQSPPV